MEKELVICIYDGGFNWSFSSGNRIYNREGYKSICRSPRKYTEQICGLCNLIEVNSIWLPYINEHWPECKRIILCEDGEITILNKGKGGLFNAH